MPRPVPYTAMGRRDTGLSYPTTLSSYGRDTPASPPDPPDCHETFDRISSVSLCILHPESRLISHKKRPSLHVSKCTDGRFEQKSGIL